MQGGIEHKGIIQAYDKGQYRVQYSTETACETCSAKTACGIGTEKERIVDIPDEPGKYEVGEEVQLHISQSAGTKAVFYAYVFPFLLVLTCLIIASEYYGELMAGLAAVGILIPYFIVLYLFRNKLKKTFRMRIEKI